MEEIKVYLTIDDLEELLSTDNGAEVYDKLREVYDKLFNEDEDD
jgi:flagellin-specific chaperone FliS